MDRGVRLAPSSVALYQSRAYLRAALGRRNDGLLDLDRAKALDPLPTSVLMNRVDLLVAAGRWREAQQTLDRMPGDDPDLMLRRFRVYSGTGQRARAAAIALARGYSDFTLMVPRWDAQGALRYGRRPSAADSACLTAVLLHQWWIAARAPAGDQRREGGREVP